MEENLYQYLIKLAEGDKSFITKIKYYDEPNIIDSIKFNENTPLKSIIKLEFNTREFFELFPYNDYDMDLIEKIMSTNYRYYYGGPDFFDSYWAEEEWHSGYMIDNLTDDFNIIKTIVKNIDPSFNFEETDRELNEKIASLLSELDESSVDDITTEYVNLVNSSCNKAYYQMIKSETQNKFMSLGIYEKLYSETYYTTLGNLIRLIEKFNLQESDVSLYKIIEIYCENIDVTDELYELQYDIAFDYYDNDEFKENIKRYLNNLLEKSEEFLNQSPNGPELRKMMEIINQKGGFNTWIDLREKESKINFQSINPENNTVVYLMKSKNSSWRAEQRSVTTLDELNNVLYHPELFEQLKQLAKKLLSEQESYDVPNTVKDFIVNNPEIVNNEPLPIDILNNKISMYNSKTTPNPNLHLDDLYELTKQPNPPFKIDLFGINGQVIKTFSYDTNPNTTFTLTLNPVWGKTLPGIKINF
jgi:hypothetical protein